MAGDGASLLEAMNEYFNTPFFWGLASGLGVGLLVAAWAWVAGYLKRRDLHRDMTGRLQAVNDEVEELRQHLHTQMQITAKGTDEREKQSGRTESAEREPAGHGPGLAAETRAGHGADAGGLAKGSGADDRAGSRVCPGLATSRGRVRSRGGGGRGRLDEIRQEVPWFRESPGPCRRARWWHRRRQRKETPVEGQGN